MLLRPLLLVITVLIGVCLLILMVVGWSRRSRRHGTLRLSPVPALGAGSEEHSAMYVATTVAGDPYDRISAGGLGFRGAASVSVHPEGVLVRRRGEVDLWIPVGALLATGTATWTIDRSVEPGGLTVLRWRLGGREVETYLRPIEPNALTRELQGISHRGNAAMKEWS